MCCFSSAHHLNHVSATRIFARRTAANRQLLVYSMDIDALGELAMILPIPTPPASAEDAVQFIDLSHYSRFFDSLEEAFARPIPKGGGRMRSLPKSAPRTLKVYDVGSFVASFVPSQTDFSRLDHRFRIADDIWKNIPSVADYGFAVFQLKGFDQREGSTTAEPMAFSFPSREAQKLFFPTLHIHDGEVSEEAFFDHTLFAQVDPESPMQSSGAFSGRRWQRSQKKAGEVLITEKARELVSNDDYLYKTSLSGKLANKDCWLT